MSSLPDNHKLHTRQSSHVTLASLNEKDIAAMHNHPELAVVNLEHCAVDAAGLHGMAEMLRGAQTPAAVYFPVDAQRHEAAWDSVVEAVLASRNRDNILYITPPDDRLGGLLRRNKSTAYDLVTRITTRPESLGTEDYKTIAHRMPGITGWMYEMISLHALDPGVRRGWWR